MTKIEQAAPQAFETWWENDGQEFLYALNTTTDDDIRLVARFAWESGAYYAEQAKQAEIPEWVDVDDYEEQKQEPVAWIDLTEQDKWSAYCDHMPPTKNRKLVFDAGISAGIKFFKEKNAALVQQAEQEPVVKIALKNCIYFDSIDFNQTPPYLRYDTGDSTPQENWTVYRDIQDDLREDGYELTDSGVDHDTVWGYVTPIAAPVQQAEQEPVAILKSSKANFERQFGKQVFADWVYDDLTYSFENSAPVQPVKQEPVAWGVRSTDDFLIFQNESQAHHYATEWEFEVTPLYAAPVRTKDLTDAEKDRIALVCSGAYEIIDAAIAADREKNK